VDYFEITSGLIRPVPDSTTSWTATLLEMVKRGAGPVKATPKLAKSKF
jgi:hypothetical protein